MFCVCWTRAELQARGHAPAQVAAAPQPKNPHVGMRNAGLPVCTGEPPGKADDVHGSFESDVRREKTSSVGNTEIGRRLSLAVRTRRDRSMCGGRARRVWDPS